MDHCQASAVVVRAAEAKAGSTAVRKAWPKAPEDEGERSEASAEAFGFDAFDEGDEFEAFVNPRTKWEAPAVGEPAMRSLKAGAIVQLERKGFYRVDVPALDDARPMVLFAVPDGRPRPVGVAAAWEAAQKK